MKISCFERKSQIWGLAAAKQLLNFWPKSHAEGQATELPIKNACTVAQRNLWYFCRLCRLLRLFWCILKRYGAVILLKVQIIPSSRGYASCWDVSWRVTNLSEIITNLFCVFCFYYYYYFAELSLVSEKQWFSTKPCFGWVCVCWLLWWHF